MSLMLLKNVWDKTQPNILKIIFTDFVCFSNLSVRFRAFVILKRDLNETYRDQSVGNELPLSLVLLKFAFTFRVLLANFKNICIFMASTVAHIIFVFFVEMA